jgi:hypothetical protein
MALMIKHITCINLFCAMTAAFPLFNDRAIQAPRNIPNNPGIQFHNGSLSITVFSDLHFGDCKSRL